MYYKGATLAAEPVTLDAVLCSATVSRIFDDTDEFHEMVAREFRRNPRMPALAECVREIFPSSTDGLIMKHLLTIMRIPRDRKERLLVVSSLHMFYLLFSNYERRGFDYLSLLIAVTDFLYHVATTLPQDVRIQWLFLVVAASKCVWHVPPDLTGRLYDFLEAYAPLDEPFLIALVAKHLFANGALAPSPRFRGFYNLLNRYITRQCMLELSYEYVRANPDEVGCIVDILAESGKLVLEDVNMREITLIIQFLFIGVETGTLTHGKIFSGWKSLCAIFLRIVAAIDEFRSDISPVIHLVVRTAESPDKLVEVATRAVHALIRQAAEYDEYTVCAKSNIYKVYLAMMLYIPSSTFAELHSACIKWLQLSPDEHPEDAEIAHNFAAYAERMTELNLEIEYLSR
jgi:hypothetical protein